MFLFIRSTSCTFRHLLKKNPSFGVCSPLAFIHYIANFSASGQQVEIAPNGPILLKWKKIKCLIRFFIRLIQIQIILLVIDQTVHPIIILIIVQIFQSIIVSILQPIIVQIVQIVHIVHLIIVQIVDVDEKNQILTTNCWLTQVWNDTHLTWNYSGTSAIYRISTYDVNIQTKLHLLQ